MNKRIFVTGSSGFVAHHLIPMLAKNDYQVTAHVKLASEKNKVKAKKIVVGDLSQKGQWAKALKGHDVIVHLAAEISAKDPNSFIKNNVIATQNLVDSAQKAQVKKIILFSSAAVTSIRQDQYAMTKKKQEEIVIKSKIDYVILRPSMIYGPGDTKNIGWLIKMISKLPIIPLPGGGKFGRQPIYVDDICKIVLKLLAGNYKKQIYEIHGKEYVTMAKMVKVITSEKKIKKITLFVPVFFLLIFFWVAGKILKNPKFTVDQIKSLISGEKFKGEKWWSTFDIIPTSFEKGVAQMIKQ